MRWLLPLLAACTTTSPSTIVAESHVEIREVPQSLFEEADLLFVIDSSPAMASYRERMQLNATSIIHRMSYLADSPQHEGRPDLRIAVTTMDPATLGALRRVGTMRAPFLTDAPAYDGSRITNFVGDLADVFADLVDVGATGSTAVAPLAAAKQALEMNPDFHRPGTGLVIVLVTANDEATTTDTQAYADWFKAAEPDSNNVRVEIVAGDPGGCSFDGVAAAPTPVLSTFAAQFPYRATFTSICQSDFASGVSLEGVFKYLLGIACFEEAIEPARCTSTDFQTDHELAVVPLCGHGDMPCARFTSDFASCTSGNHMTVRIDRPSRLPRGILTRFECEVD